MLCQRWIVSNLGQGEWNTEDVMEMVVLSFRFIIISFSLIDDGLQTLEGGPWFVGKLCLFSQSGNQVWISAVLALKKSQCGSDFPAYY